MLDIVEKRSDMEIKYVLVRRPRPELGALAVSDAAVIPERPEVDTVVEVLGGLPPRLNMSPRR